MIYNFQ
jgi:L-ascorbate metabolism protein UlaG (beta-lactamase superfamily)